MPGQEFLTAGQETDRIAVRISYRIIHLFSEGLYSSPHKAIEELVSNAFDAGAAHVHVVLSADLSSEDATIAVVDDGEGMDGEGLKQHWLIGVSNKRSLSRLPKARKQIGRFGIGKLATYVLANRLTHICKSKEKYYATSMDYRAIHASSSEGVFDEKSVYLPLRQLTAEEAKTALAPFITGSKPGYKALRLFGKGAASSWSVAIMSNLKPMAGDIRQGTLRWVLRTAMPLRDDFALYLNGEKQESSKLSQKLIRKWVLGKDLLVLPKPAPEGLEASEKDSVHRYGLAAPLIGRVTGYVELSEDPLTGSKSDEIERSNGFFVYVRERLINIHDPGFGINRNLLRHGTFSRFRMVVHVDKLDDDLRSSRETVRQGTLCEAVRDLLHGAFNLARNEHEEHERKQSPGALLAARFAATPGSLSRRPILDLTAAAVIGKCSPIYVSFPRNLGAKEREAFLKRLEKRADEEGALLTGCQLVELSQQDGLAVFDVESGVLQINMFHPFVAYFLDEYENKMVSQPLEILAMSEVLTEANLYQLGLEEERVRDILVKRDELLRLLVRASGKRSALAVSLALADAKTDKKQLETELVAAFEQMGFEAFALGGAGKPDGIAEAHLAAAKEGEPRFYRVCLEAKSKEQAGAKVTNDGVHVSAISRLRDEYKCDHALIVGPDFPTTRGDKSALIKEIRADRRNKQLEGKTITLVRVDDLAKLVRLVNLKRVGLDKIRELFQNCIAPDEVKEWIAGVEGQPAKTSPYREILDAIWGEQHDLRGQPVEYAAVEARLRLKEKILLPRQEIIECCKALCRMVPSLVIARQKSVDLTSKPEIIIRDVKVVISQFPEEERRKASIKF